MADLSRKSLRLQEKPMREQKQLKEQVFAFVDKGYTSEDAAKQFGVKLSQVEW